MQLKDKSIILFDLDGTLTDPKTGIVNGIEYALSHFGIKAAGPESLTAWIGPPLIDSFQNYCALDKPAAQLALNKYREYYSQTGLYENTLYDGMDTLLAELTAAGKTLALATSKPRDFALRVLEHFDLESYFAFVSGSELDGSRAHKPEIIAYALGNLGTEAGDAVMIGDRRYDIEGAHAAGLPAIGVLYGYGLRDELTAAGADCLAASVADLRALLLE